MNWKDCVRQNELIGIRTRFEWPVGQYKGGFDCNDSSTVNDILGGISWLWTWPGDYLLNLPEVKSFFEMSSETVVGSGWSSALTWLILVVVAAAFLD